MVGCVKLWDPMVYNRVCKVTKMAMTLYVGRSQDASAEILEFLQTLRKVTSLVYG